MKFLIFFCFITNVAMAQKTDVFTLAINEKVVATKVAFTENKSITFKKTNLKKGANFLIITIKEIEASKEMNRIFKINNENGTIENETTFLKTNGVFKIKFRLLVSKEKQEIKLSTYSIPKDPAKAALVRVRSYNLATVTFE